MFKASVIDLMLPRFLFCLFWTVLTVGRYEQAGIHPEVFWKMAVLKFSENSQGSNENSFGKVMALAYKTKLQLSF